MTMAQSLAVMAVLAAVAIVVGVVWACGPAYGLIAGGVLVLIGVVMLYDPEMTKRRK